MLCDILLFYHVFVIVWMSLERLKPEPGGQCEG
jgi:hypothetical protein